MSEVKNSPDALARAFAALTYPTIVWIVVVCFVLTILSLWGLWELVTWLLTGWKFFNWGWVNWMVDTFTGIVIFFVVLLLFPAVLMIITSMFLDYIVKAVEKRDYPDLPEARNQPIGELIAYIVKFTLWIIAINLLVLPLYLLLPAINFLIAWVVNGYLIGREYYELVAMRRLTPKEMKALRQEQSGVVFRGGFLMAVLFTVPFLNLLMPVVSAAYMTHVFHKLPCQAKAIEAPKT